MKIFFVATVLLSSVLCFAKPTQTNFGRDNTLSINNELNRDKVDLYNSKYQSAKKKLTPLFKAWIYYNETGNEIYLNRAIILADELTSEIRYMSSNRSYGDLEELNTLAIIAYFEFFRDFAYFSYRKRTSQIYPTYEVLNFRTVVANFYRIYFNELEQPKI